MTSSKQRLVKMLPNLLVVAIIYILIIISPWKTWLSITGIILGVTIIIDVIRYRNKTHIFREEKYYLDKARLIIIVTIFFFLIKWLGAYGLWGVVAIVLGICAYRLYKSRSEYIGTMREIETKIWGAPLDERKKKNDDERQTKNNLQNMP